MTFKIDIIYMQCFILLYLLYLTDNSFYSNDSQAMDNNNISGNQDSENKLFLYTLFRVNLRWKIDSRRMVI